jgi:hypothetical protein
MQWPTMSAPMLRWNPTRRAMRVLVPTPSFVATSTGSFIPGKDARNIPANAPVSVRTRDVNVERTLSAIPSSMEALAFTSTPASRYQPLRPGPMPRARGAAPRARVREGTLATLGGPARAARYRGTDGMLPPDEA